MTANGSDLRHVSNNFMAMQKAADRIARFYDAQLAPSGLRITQFAILVLVNELEDVRVSSIAANLLLDRATTSRNLKQLAEAGLIRIAPAAQDRRARSAAITARGHSQLKAAVPLWRRAQTRFEELNGVANAASMRTTLRNLVLEA
jgi:DNA-binding MarR family transcriptional regulator